MAAIDEAACGKCGAKFGYKGRCNNRRTTHDFRVPVSAIAAALDGLRPDLPTTGAFRQTPDHIAGRASAFYDARRALLGEVPTEEEQ